MTHKKVIVHFLVLTFGISYFVSGALIALGQYGYSVHNWVDSLQKFGMNVPFAIYILSPAIASYIVLKKHKKIAGFKEWLKTVFYANNNVFLYLFIAAALIFYFGLHMAASGRTEMLLPLYTVFLFLPGGIIIGGLEEAGWMYVLQPEFDKKYGYVLACILIGLIWILWHIPLFFIPGTNHGKGLINFWMFNVQVVSLSFFRGAIYKISSKGYVFVFLVFHAMFNAASSILGAVTMTWAGTIAANTLIIVVSIAAVAIYNKKKRGKV